MLKLYEERSIMMYMNYIFPVLSLVKANRKKYPSSSRASGGLETTVDASPGPWAVGGG